MATSVVPLILAITVALIALHGFTVAEAFDYYGGIGQPCSGRSYWDGFRQRGACDESRGFTCQNYPEYGGFVCACPKPYAYDPHSEECRLPLRSSCTRTTATLKWSEKCQMNAECFAGYAGYGRGLCKCKPGFYPSYGGDFCER